ncbi:MAG: twin-arginine translocase TatA/TatE family subunit [Chthoniobacterales bacterium]
MITLGSLMNLGGPDMIVVLLIILVLFGAKRLPDLAKGMGQAMREFHKAKDEFGHELVTPVARAGDVNPSNPVRVEPDPQVTAASPAFPVGSTEVR